MTQAESTKLISYEELARHNSKTNLWIALDGKVFDVTQHLEKANPKDQEFFVLNAGTDATYQLNMRDKEGKALFDNELMEKLCVGTLDPNSAKVAPKDGTDIQRMYTYLEISKHNKGEDCWVIVHDKVFDVTEFLDEHPGGAAMILDFGGKDCTEAYVDHSHSQHATKLLMGFQVGVVDPNSKHEFVSAKSQQSKNALIGVVVISIALLLASYFIFLK